MTEWINWYGELTRPGRLRTRGLLFLALGVSWLAVLLVLPLIALIAVAFAQRGDYGEIHWQLTLANLYRVLGFGSFGWSADTLWILGRSLVVAGVTTVICLLLSYPLAFYLANKPPGSRYLWLCLVMIPLCTNLVVRTYAWMLILSAQLPPARLAQWLGMAGEGEALYPSQLAVYLGMISSFLPFTVLPLYTVVERLDWSIVEAARDLYAGKWAVFRHAILPQTMPGLTVALVLTFIPALGAFLVPRLLGGAKYMLAGDLVQQQFNESRDYPFGAALSLGLMALTLLGLWLCWRPGHKVEGR